MLKDHIDARQTLAISALQASGLFPDGLRLEASDVSSGSENESLSNLKNRKTKRTGEEEEDDDDDFVSQKRKKATNSEIPGDKKPTIVSRKRKNSDKPGDNVPRKRKKVEKTSKRKKTMPENTLTIENRAYFRIKAPLRVIHNAVEGLLGQQMIQQIPLLGKS